MEKILKLSIVAVNKCPEQFKYQWRTVLHTINEAMKSRGTEIKKGAEIILAMTPNMLFRAPNAWERDLSTRAKWTIRFRTFWAGISQL